MAVVKRMSSKAKVGKIEKYLKQEEKTEEKLISGMNCDSDNFAKQCEITNAFYKKNQNQNDRKYYHIIQSFSPKDNKNLTLDQAHKIGEKFAEQNFKGYEVLVVTHKDKEHIHNHFVVNSVSLENGKKYRADNKSLWKLRRTSNELCQQNNLINSIQPLEKKAKEKINDAEIRGKQSWQGTLKSQIIAISKTANSLDDFRKKLNERYNVETQIVTRTRKGKKEEILEYKPKGNRKFFDGQRRLGTEFGKEYIHELTRGNAEKERGRIETEPGTDTSRIEDAIRNRQIELINADIEHRKREFEKSNIEHERDRGRENQSGTGVAEPKNRIEPAKEKPTYKPRTR